MELTVRTGDPHGSTLVIGPPSDNRWPANPAARVGIRTARDFAVVHMAAEDCRAVAAVLLALAGSA